MVRPFIPSSKNTSIPKDDYYTTPDIFDTLGLRFDLIPISRGRWFHEAWSRLSGIVPTPARLHFIKQDGSKAAIFTPTFFGAMGESNVQALRNFERRVR